ncbi:hypothetical protein [Aquabacter cavernae]|uniref:hypothetical protein n=1 Tax=Aquabacter cavernae TaxID=2496029 RepID=UPI000F8D2251|nr:hypothetical protein [Aquabacter cavernae]
MYQVSDQHLFWWPATAMMPDKEKPGQFRSHAFQLYFQELDETQLEEIEAEAIKKGQRVEPAVLKAAVRGWKDVVGQDDSPLTFSETNLLAAMRFAGFRVGAFRAYRDAMNGEAARLGN